MRHINTDTVFGIGFVAVVVGLIVLFFQDAQQDAQREQDRDAAKASAVTCIKNVVAAANDSTSERAKAAQVRDDALVGSKKALRELIRLRVIEGISSDAQVQEAAEQYLFQTRRFIEASEALGEARRDNPVPDVEAVCR